MKVFGRCATCGKTNLEVRLYRPYGNFYRVEDNYCNEHVPEDSRSWYVPLIFDVDGGVWGYTSVPMDQLKAFYALPEANPTALSWYVGVTAPGESRWKNT